MKPKPFASLNHFTVPVAISTVLRGVVAPLVDPTSRGRVLRASASVPRHGVAEMPLDRAQLVPFLGHGEARRLPGRLGTRGAADAVDVIFRRVRKVEVDDVRDLRHVDAARGDVRRHQDAIAAGAMASSIGTLRCISLNERIMSWICPSRRSRSEASTWWGTATSTRARRRARAEATGVGPKPCGRSLPEDPLGRGSLRTR